MSPRASAGSLTARLLSPTGFVLAGLGVLLPFGAVSCTVATGKRETLTYTGAQLIGQTGGTISMSPQLRDELGQAAGQVPASTDPNLLGQAHAGSLRYLLIAALVTVLVGALAAAVRTRSARNLVAVGAALATLILLVGAQIAGRHAVETWFGRYPDAFATPPASGRLPAGVAVHPGLGFWLSVGLLIAVGAGNVLAMLRGSDDPAPAAQAPPPDETPDPDARPKPRMRA